MKSSDRLSEINQKSWNDDSYGAWVNRFGSPEEAADKIKQSPEKTISHIYRYFGDVKGKKILNLMGSNGLKAVALATLGAQVTVADFSHSNKRYAKEVSDCAGVTIRYLVCDVLELDEKELMGSFDIIFAEMGILHYFSDLTPLMKKISLLLKKDGLFLLRDFHPLTTKLISSRGTTAKIRKHKVTGDYFDTALHEKEISYAKYAEDTISEEDSSSPKVLLRFWNLGEIITAIACAPLTIQTLTEEPNLSSEVFDKGIPKTFHVTAIKPRDIDIES